MQRAGPAPPAAPQGGWEKLAHPVSLGIETELCPVPGGSLGIQGWNVTPGEAGLEVQVGAWLAKGRFCPTGSVCGGGEGYG